MNKDLALLIAALMVFGGIFAFSAYKIVCYYTEASAEESGFDDVVKALEDAQAKAYDAQIGDNSQSSDTEINRDTASDEAAKKAALAGYSALAEETPDFFGWIKISGTVINYPVMHTPDEPEKYLHLSFDGKNTKSGTPFLAAECRKDCKNYIIYAHNMKSGAMFAGLMKYRKQSFWEEHKTVCFDTPDSLGEYRVIAVFYGNAGENSDFRYFAYTDLTQQAHFDEYIAKVKENALYYTGEEVSFGDELLTLSTCTNRSDDERLVVVAKRVN